MKEEEKLKIIETSWQMHSQVENSYLQHGAKKGDDNWLEKQRLLLADMALHLLQTSLNPGKIDLEKLRNNLNAILVITDQFLPDAELKRATERLFRNKE